MKEQRHKLGHTLTIMYLSWFGAGRAKKAPGTFGTLAALPFIYAWSLLAPPEWLSVTLLTVMTVLACVLADKTQREEKVSDPQWIVVDEVIGMAITWFVAGPQNFFWWALAFAAFRFFDIVKFWPASYFDQQVKNGWGTILDDVVSGVYAGIFVKLASYFFYRS